MLGGWWATLNAIVLPWPRTAGSCAWHAAQKQGEDKHSQQTLTDIHKSAEAYLLYYTSVVRVWVGSVDRCCGCTCLSVSAHV